MPSLSLQKTIMNFINVLPVLISQCCPSHPGKHSHLKRPCCKATHVAPLAHGLPFAVHGFICQKTYYNNIIAFASDLLNFPIKFQN